MFSQVHFSNGFEKLNDELSKEYFQKLENFLEQTNDTIYPARENIFKVFELCPLKDIKVVILGQDPYHGPKQAHGLCFSVPKNVPHPPSLRNIFKEVMRDIGCRYPQSGNLEPWAQSGVFLLNAILTVSAGKAASHRNLGWEQFTDRVIELLSAECPYLVFMLWGNYAQSKIPLIDKRHLILQSSHPSPLSAHVSFVGNGHFSAANAFLRRHGIEEVNWCLP